ncbi:hypothetical protein LCGC14_2989090, partial [marine sediment metagenome]
HCRRLVVRDAVFPPPRPDGLFECLEGGIARRRFLFLFRLLVWIQVAVWIRVAALAALAVVAALEAPALLAGAVDRVDSVVDGQLFDVGLVVDGLDARHGRLDVPRDVALVVALLAALAIGSLIVPVGLMASGITSIGPLRDFVKLHGDEALFSFVIALAGSAVAIGLAWSALALDRAVPPGRVLGKVMQVTMLIAMLLPGSLMGMALLRARAMSGLPVSVTLHWPIVSAGCAARFAGVALVALRMARDSRDRHLDEMARVDGASALQAWLRIHLRRMWAVPVGVGILLTMFGMTELPATMVLLPAGVPNFAQRLLNQMHYARDQQVIASCTVLVGAYGLLTALAAGMLGLLRRRPAAGRAMCVALAA